MTKGVTETHLEPMWNISEPSDVPFVKQIIDRELLVGRTIHNTSSTI